jgi:putative acetyltransferase
MNETSPMTIAPARIPYDIDSIRALYVEYIESLGIDLSFQDIDTELANLPGKYAPPAGIILLARDNHNVPVGCIALRPITSTHETGTAEMKRLYVRPEARGHDLGRRLVLQLIDHARSVGYTRMILDTLASLHSARKLYTSLGFVEVEPYYDNPLPGVIYMARELRD